MTPAKISLFAVYFFMAVEIMQSLTGWEVPCPYDRYVELWVER